jgi:hypothetical protein
MQVEDRLDILIGRTINTCRESAIDELEILEFSPQITKTERVHRLLYLLHKDILASPIGGLILENKFIRDAYYQHGLYFPSYALQFAGASMQQAILVILSVGCSLLAIAMVGYILFFAMTQTPERQYGWLASFSTWIAFDVVLVSTFEVLVTNVGLPSLIMSDVQAAKQQVCDLEKKFQKEPASVAELQASGKSDAMACTPPLAKSPVAPARRRLQKELSLRTVDATPVQGDGSTVNCAQYFFVSHRVARYFTDIPDSQVISSYATALPPGDSFRRSWMRPLNMFLQRVVHEDRRLNRMVQRGGFRVQAGYHFVLDEAMLAHFLTGVFECYLRWSFFAQDTLVQLLLTSLLFFLLLLHVQLYNIISYLVVLPLVLVLLLVVIYRSVTHSHGQLRRIVEFMRHRNKVVPFNESLASESFDSFKEADNEDDDVSSAKRHSVKASSNKSSSKSAKFLRSASKQGKRQVELKPQSSKYGFESFDDYDDAVMDFSDDDNSSVYPAHQQSKSVAAAMIEEPLFVRGDSVASEVDQSSTVGSYRETDEEGTAESDLQVREADDTASSESSVEDSTPALVYPLNVKSRSMSPTRMDALMHNVAQLSLEQSTNDSSYQSSAVTSTTATPRRITSFTGSPITVNTHSEASGDLATKEPLNTKGTTNANAQSPVDNKYSRFERSPVLTVTDTVSRLHQGVSSRRGKKLAPTEYAFGRALPVRLLEEDEEEKPTPPPRLRSVVRAVQVSPQRLATVNSSKQNNGATSLPQQPASKEQSGARPQAQALEAAAGKEASEADNEEKLAAIIRKIAVREVQSMVTPSRKNNGPSPSAKFTAPRIIPGANAATPTPGPVVSAASVQQTPVAGAAAARAKAIGPTSSSKVTHQRGVVKSYDHVSDKVNAPNPPRSTSVKRGARAQGGFGATEESSKKTNT